MPEEDLEGYLAFSTTLARHWDGVNGTGSALDVTGTTCAGGINLTGGAWNDRISSTTHRACANVKHYTGVYAGTHQLTTGGSGAIRNLNSTLNNNVSSVEYS